MHLATIGLNVVKLPGLARCRAAATLSQRELAKLADVSHVTIARLEGGYDAHPRTIRKLAEALRVTPAELQRLNLSGPAQADALRKLAETLDIDPSTLMAQPPAE